MQNEAYISDLLGSINAESVCVYESWLLLVHHHKIRVYSFVDSAQLGCLFIKNSANVFAVTVLLSMPMSLHTDQLYIIPFLYQLYIIPLHDSAYAYGNCNGNRCQFYCSDTPILSFASVSKIKNKMLHTTLQFRYTYVTNNCVFVEYSPDDSHND